MVMEQSNCGILIARKASRPPDHTNIYNSLVYCIQCAYSVHTLCIHCAYSVHTVFTAYSVHTVFMCITSIFYSFQHLDYALFP